MMWPLKHATVLRTTLLHDIMLALILLMVTAMAVMAMVTTANTTWVGAMIMPMVMPMVVPMVVTMSGVSLHGWVCVSRRLCIYYRSALLWGLSILWMTFRYKCNELICVSKKKNE